MECIYFMSWDKRLRAANQLKNEKKNEWSDLIDGDSGRPAALFVFIHSITSNN